MKKFLILVPVIFSFFCMSCNSKEFKPDFDSKTFIIQTSSGTNIPVKAEIAKTDEQRSYGFMYRKKIPDGTGMIFIFEYDQLLSFWMKNTPTPLSLAYIDSTGKIRSIFDMKPFSLEPVKSTSSARYALEVPQGWFKANGIKNGDKIDLSPLHK